MKKSNSSSRGVFRISSAVALAIGSVSLLAVPSLASAQPFGQGGGHGFGKRGRGGRGGPGMLMRGDLKRVQKRLGLSPAQVQQLKLLRQQNKGALAALRLKMMRLQAKMKVEWLADKPDAIKLRKLHSQKLKVKAEMAQKRFNIRVKISQILTPSQRLKLRAGKHRGRRFAQKHQRRRGFKRGGFGF
ncbi:MAG: Spy/CpxP family protein refolding chaperone [bacterium]